MVGIHLDMTKQKQLSEKFQNLQNYLSNIINSMPSMLIGVNPEGKITQWNNKAEEVTGIKEKEVEGKMLTDVLPHMKKDLKKIKESITTRKITSNTKKPRLVNNEICYEDVTIYPLTSNGVTGAVIRIDDVTEKVNIEEMMIQSEKMLSIGGLAAGMAHEIN
ncbi:MAG: PAS domain S-box protein, partial [Calditrichia bacterium]|nr:PAS domain S-box protein [Calditrichia bacterium]